MNNAGRIGFLIKGNYKSTETYSFLDIVYNPRLGKSFVAKRQVTGIEPIGNTDDWQIFAEGFATIDDELDPLSDNPVINKAIATAIEEIGESVEEINNTLIAYGECSTPMTDIAKVVSIPGIAELSVGITIRVRFTSTETTKATSGNITLNLNGLGAKTVVDGHSNKTVLNYSSSFFYNNMVCEFVYDGTYWVYMNRDNNTTYNGSSLKTSVAKTGSGTTVTNTINANTSLDSVVGTLLNNDYKINSDLTGVKSDLKNVSEYGGTKSPGYINTSIGTAITITPKPYPRTILILFVYGNYNTEACMPQILQIPSNATSFKISRVYDNVGATPRVTGNISFYYAFF